MEQDIQDAVQYINEIYRQDFKNEDQLEDIMYQYLTSGNDAFIDNVFKNLLPEQGLFFITMMKDMASIKGYVLDGKSIVSHLYAIPFIAIQDSNNMENSFSKTDMKKIESLFEKYGITEKYEVSVYETMLTPHSVPKEPVDINNAHDSIIFDTLPIPDINNFSKGVGDFHKIVKEDKQHFHVDDLTFTLRYMMLSIREADVENDGVEISLTDFVDSINSDEFCEDLQEILSQYYQDILMAFIPVPYIDGVEIGIIEYNSMMVLHSFSPIIDAIGVESLEIVVDHSEMGTLRVMLVDKIHNVLSSEYKWAVPILTDSSIRHNIQYLQDLCDELGFDGYSVGSKDDSAKMTIH